MPENTKHGSGRLILSPMLQIKKKRVKGVFAHVNTNL